MIEKQCGPLPHWMCSDCGNNSIQRHLNVNKNETGPRLRWPSSIKNAESDRRVKQMLLLDDIILDEFGPDHIALKNLLKYMLVVD